MNRQELIGQLFPKGVDTLWCPLLTHYIVRHGRVTVDPRRIVAQMRNVVPHVSQFLVAGSTGDGWNLDPQQFNDLLLFTARDAYWTIDSKFLFGALAPTTSDVIRRGHTIISKLGEDRVPGFIGIAVCPPVNPKATQDEIREHYDRICHALNVPIAVYQLPQVTGCRIEPKTLAALIASHPNIYLFKDTSGEDTIAKAGEGLDDVIVVRGAESDYVESLKCGGGAYDGLLLSTTNVFSYSLRNLVDTAVAGDREAALRASKRLTTLVKRLFDAVAACPSGNAFSNMNRAVDHIIAHGPHWDRVEPPMLFDGSRITKDILAEVAAIFDKEEGIPEQGYFIHRYVGLE